MRTIIAPYAAALILGAAIGILASKLKVSQDAASPRKECAGKSHGAVVEKENARAESRGRTSTADRSPADGAGTKRLPPGPIIDELVVRLPEGITLEEWKRRMGITAGMVGKIGGLNAYRLKFASEDEARKAKAFLRENPHLASVEANERLAKPEFRIVSDEPSILEPNSLRLGENNGQLIVGLIDTAVQGEGVGLEGILLSPLSITGDEVASGGGLSHGTAMASAIVQGLNMVMDENSTTTARILPVDVYGNSETTTSYQVAEGMYAAVEAGATVINLSLGSDTESALLQDIIREATAQGVVVLAAAGNTPTSDPTYPAAYEEVIAVTAIDEAGGISSYANYGDFVDVGMNGSVIVSHSGGRTKVTGTSAATALTSGVTLGLADKNSKSVSEVEPAIREGLSIK
jgi:hypothetical protein